MICKTKRNSIKSVLGPAALLILATIIATTNSIQTTLAQPIMDASSMKVGNGSTSGMNFNPLSVANNLFNASSIYGSVGISMVNGVKVTSINLLGNNEISVTLKHLSPSTNDANANTMSSPPRVTVTAIRAPLNLKDLMTLASESGKMMAHDTNNTMINPMMMGGPMHGFGGAANNDTNKVNPMFLLTTLQIGSSSTAANADWNLPQVVRMGLTGMLGTTNTKDSTASTADFVIVMVIPYTGKV